MSLIKEVNFVKHYFDNKKVHIGDKIHVRSILSCEIRPDGSRQNIVYDIDAIGEVIDIDGGREDDSYLTVKFGENDYLEIDIEDVIDGEYELEVVNGVII